MTDIFDLREAHHAEAERLFDRLESAPIDERMPLFFQLVDNLAMQASIEETQVFPTIRGAGAAPLIEAARRAHASIRMSLADMLATDPRIETEEFDALLYLLRREVARHVLDEECVLFPALRGSLAA